MPVRAWKARKTLTERFRRSGAPIPLARGFQVARNRDQPPAKPICTVQAATRLVGGRRPSVLQRWGSGVLPETVSGCAQGAAGTVAARSFWRVGEQKHARDFEAAKEQCRIDNPMSNVNI
uniref:Rep protein n=1 Tax=Escherichia coli TaxID=562 RepID=A0A3G4RXD6_ECOLX|nr:hypothetical protein D0362_00188 [Escherichia coli]